jgi:hypothetical protein
VRNAQSVDHLTHPRFAWPLLGETAEMCFDDPMHRTGTRDPTVSLGPFA